MNKEITNEELAVIRNVFKRLDMECLIDYGNPTEDIIGFDYSKFFQLLPSVIVELSKEKRFAHFIESLDIVSETLYQLSISADTLASVGYFFSVVAEAANKEAIEKYEREKEASSINKMIDEACNGLLS